MKKLAKNNVPMFLAIVRENKEIPQEKKTRRKSGRKQSSVFCGMTAQGHTEGHKRQKMKLEGPKKDFKSVQEKEEELVDSVDVQYRASLR